MSIQYTTVFDIAQQDVPWWGLVPGVFVLLVTLIIWRSRYAWAGRGPGGGFFVSRVILTLAIIGAVGWLLAVGVVTLTDYSQATSWLADGRAQVIEGPVANFTPQPAGDHGVESFTVEHVPFSYGTASLEPGFREASTHGGPITHDGIPVRIHYFTDPASDRNVILRLEIGK